MARYRNRITGEIIDAETPEEAARIGAARRGAPPAPVPAAPTSAAPLPTAPAPAPAPPTGRTDVALDPEGRVLTAPFQAEAISRMPQAGGAALTPAETLSAIQRGASAVTGLPLGGGTQFDPLTVGLNVLSLAPPLAAARAAPPVVRAGAGLLAPLAQTATRRVATGAAIGALEAAGPATGAGAPPSEVGEAAFGGAVSGAARTLPGELLGGGARRTTQAFGAGAVKRQVKEQTYRAIEEAVPWVTTEMREGVSQQVPIRTDADVHRLFVRGDAFRNLGQNFDRSIAHVVDTAGNPRIVVPTLAARRKAPAGTTVDLREAFSEVSKLGQLAYRGAADTPTKQAAREAHRAMMGEIEEALAQQSNGDLALSLYRQAREQYKEGLAMTTFLQKVPKLTAEGQVNTQAIRSAAENAKQAAALAKKFPEGLDQLIEALNRGAGPLVGAERVGAAPSVTISPSLRGGLIPGLGVSPGQLPTVPGWQPFMDPAQRAYLDVLTQAMRRAAAGEVAESPPGMVGP
jgi:hypothetical protein